MGRMSHQVYGGADMLGGCALRKLTGKIGLMADSSVLGKVGGRRKELNHRAWRGDEKEGEIQSLLHPETGLLKKKKEKLITNSWKKVIFEMIKFICIYVLQITN